MTLESNPDARRYHMVALHRIDEAETLFEQSRPNGTIYLAGFAVECILKSVILANSTRDERLRLRSRLVRVFGHDLDALRREAARRGLHMTREAVDAFRRLNSWDNDFRYDPRLQSKGTAGSLLEAAGKVIRWAERVGGSGDD